MKRCLYRHCVCLTAAWLMVASLTRASAAYDSQTHAGLVREAFEFIIASAHDKEPYADGSKGESDYALVRRVLTPTARSEAQVNEELRRTGSKFADYGPIQFLAEASKETDNADDVFADDGSGVAQSSLYVFSYGTVYLTTVSHFVNLYDSTSPFDRAGYSFAWNTNKTRCSAGFKDHMANYLFATFGEARLATGISPPYRNYRLPLRISDEEYERAMSGQPLKAVQFWPLTHLAEHYYRAFRSTPKSPVGTPLMLGALGPVLHAAGDSTVPFHATGISGCGHVEFESFVESFYDARKRTGRLAVMADVKKLLMAPSIGAVRTHLKRSLTVSQILEGNAAVASQPPLCGCPGPCDCSIANLPAAKRKDEARKLVNLAVASTVVLIRKALTDWAPDAVKASAAEGTGAVVVTPPPSSRRYESFNKAPIVEPLLLSMTPLASVISGKLVAPLTSLKRLVERLSDGEISEASFRPDHQQSVGALARSFAENRDVLKEPSGSLRFQIPGLPPLLPEPPRFRAPTAREAEIDSAWRAYIDLSDRFYSALFLYDSSVRRAVLDVLRRDVSRERQERIDRTLKGLTAAQEDSIKALARR